MPRFDERQGIAAAIGGVLMVVPPVIVGFPLLMASAWMSVAGFHGVHHMLWGWLSSSHQDAHGHWHDGVGRIPILYWLSVPTAYVAYQLCEAVAGGFRVFKAALT